MCDTETTPTPMNPEELIDDVDLAGLAKREELTTLGAAGDPKADKLLKPPTFPESEDKSVPGGFGIQCLDDGRTICYIDTSQSEANRMEQLFERPPYKHLIPEGIVVVRSVHKDSEGEVVEEIPFTSIRHRLADAAIRFSDQSDKARAAFLAYEKGDAEPMAKMAPTSLCFGTWDSRGGTQVKVPRILGSHTDAYNVTSREKRGVYDPGIDYFEAGYITEEEKKTPKGSKSSLAASLGTVHQPVYNPCGSVICKGKIEHCTNISLAAIRGLCASNDAKDVALRRYVFSLCLVGATAPLSRELRQGCHLVPDASARRSDIPASATAFRVVSSRDGSVHYQYITHDEALEFANRAAEEFGVGESFVATVESKAKVDDIKQDTKKKNKKNS